MEISSYYLAGFVNNIRGRNSDKRSPINTIPTIKTEKKPEIQSTTVASQVDPYLACSFENLPRKGNLVHCGEQLLHI